METATPPAPPSTARPPALPLKVGVSEVLGQDVVMAAGIHVDELSPAPLAVFHNPFTRADETLVVSRASTATALLHVHPDPGTATGWQATEVFASYTPTEVVTTAGTDREGKPYIQCYFISDARAFRSVLNSDGRTWGEVHPIDTPGARLRGLKLSHATGKRHGDSYPLHSLVASGTETGSGWILSTAPHSVWTRLDENAQITRVGVKHWVSAAAVGGKLVVNCGDIGTSREEFGKEVPGHPAVRRVVAAYGDPERAAFLILHQDGTLHLWHCDHQGRPAGSRPVGEMSFRTAVAHLCRNHPDRPGPVRWDVYGIDDDRTLWSLRQDPVRPLDDGLPRWLPPTPLDRNIAGVAASVEPVDTPTLFSYVKGKRGLRMETQDARTGMWHEHDVRAPRLQAYEITQYRVEAVVTDAKGLPVQDYPMTLRVTANASDCPVSHQGRMLTVSRDGVTLRTDGFGRIAIGVPPNGLGASSLELTAADLPAPVPVQPGRAVHTYLSGTGTLRETDPGGALEPFDKHGKTLGAATARKGGALAPRAANESFLASVAAQAIRHTALIGMGQPLPDGAKAIRFSLEPAAPKGARTAAASHQFVLLRTEEEVARHVEEVSRKGEATAYGWLGDAWNGIKHVYNEAVDGVKHLAEEARQKLRQLGGDLLRAAKNGLIEIDHAVMTGVHQLSTLAIRIGNSIIGGLKMVLHGLEQAAQFVVNVFHKIEAFVEEVIAWLKAFFDFPAIWRTKMAFQKSMHEAVPEARKVVATLRGQGDAVFGRFKKDAHTAFAQLRRDGAGKKIAELPHWQKGSQGSAGGKVSTSGVSHNAQHNWLQNHMGANSVFFPESAFDLSAAVHPAPWKALAEAVKRSGQEFSKGLQSFAEGSVDLIKDPGSLKTYAAVELLDGVEKLVDGALDLGDAIVLALLDVVDAALDAVGSMLDKELELGPVNTLWAWAAKLAGYGDDDKLTLGSLAALIGAFPVTLVYKLINGADSEPCAAGHEEAGDTADGVSWGYQLATGILQIVNGVLNSINDLGHEKTPKWLGIVTLGLTAVTYLTASAFQLTPLEGIIAGPSVAFVYSLLISCFSTGDILDFLELVAPLAETALGVAGVTMAIIQLVNQQIDQETFAQGLLLGVPGVCGLVMLQRVLDGPAGPYARAFKSAVDLLGNGAGGGLQIDLALKSKPLAAPA
ncbi:hypothetical protein [Streptomyces sp. NPDC053079]|uniref:hypothetical protein n=1 Tax=Streptomyces sp. NPDC053079 TaxID=3365697 RepID=UPI0037D236ED